MKNNYEKLANNSEFNDPNLVEKHIEKILNDLGLNWESMRNKRILDIGAGPADVAAVAKGKGIDIISLDKNPEEWAEEEIKIPDVPYVKSDAEKMPFPDETFDLIISIGGPMVILPDKEKVKNMIKEAERVLKKGGEMRFGFTNINAVGSSDVLFSDEEYATFTREQRIARINEKSLEFLQSVNPNITQEFTPSSESNDFLDNYYILRK
jgi:ubiquinone/menaquinone biosynthesis C-methylase UbiE